MSWCKKFNWITLFCRWPIDSLTKSIYRTAWLANESGKHKMTSHRLWFLVFGLFRLRRVSIEVGEKKKSKKLEVLNRINFDRRMEFDSIMYFVWSNHWWVLSIDPVASPYSLSILFIAFAGPTCTTYYVSYGYFKCANKILVKWKWTCLRD